MSAGAVATRLARLRAELRLDYVLALRRTALPTAQCRPVLLALSARDKRRQRVLDSAGRLLDCSTCASLSEPLLRRRRTLAPLLIAWQALRRAYLGIRAHPGQAAVATGIATVAVVGGVWLGNTSDQPQRPERAALVAGGEPVFTQKGESRLARHEGDRARGTGVHVLSVPSDEGFWVGPNAGRRVWVSLSGRGESPFGDQVGPVTRFRRQSREEPARADQRDRARVPGGLNRATPAGLLHNRAP